MGTLCIWCNCSMWTSEVQAAYGNICRLNFTFKMFSYRAGRLQTKRVRSNFIWKHTNVHKPIATCAVCTLTSNDEQAYSNVCRSYLYFELRTSLQQHVHIVFYIRSMNKPMGACADSIWSLKRARRWEVIHIVFLNFGNTNKHIAACADCIWFSKWRTSLMAQRRLLRDC